MRRPKLDPKIFWDTDFQKLNYTRYADAIIVRVVERGSMNDWNEIKRYYGHEKIKAAAIGARNLSKKTLHFVAQLYDTPLTKFRCYNSNLFPELHWMY